jgi:protein phosphatase
MLETRSDVPTSPIEDSTIEYQATPERGLIRVRTRCDGLTDVGLRRSNNEDNFLIARLTKRLDVCRSSFVSTGSTRLAEELAYLFVVADGLGGAAAGERASALSISTVEDFVLNCFKWFLHVEPGTADEVIHELREALRRADHEVYQKARADRTLGGMGTTLTIAYAVCGQLYVAHAGDSRAYLHRDGELHQITSDHTYAQMLLDAGQITPEAARRPGIRNVITNVVGGPTEGVHVELHKLELKDGDCLMLCTDGLSEPVPEEKIAEDLSRLDDPGDACRSLVRRALDAGGPDNITVVIARFGIDRD